MSETSSSSGNRVYGLARGCRVWQVARSTIYHQRKLPADRQARRPGPIGAAADAELIAEIRDVIETAPFYGEGHRKVRARLRLRGVRTAARRVRRLMREYDLAAPNRPPQRPANDHDGRITTNRVDTTPPGAPTWRRRCWPAAPGCTSSRLSTTATASASGCTPLSVPTAGRRWSRYGRVSTGTLDRRGPTSPPA